jgi:tetratricopeptide (TPR) repeat protein
LAGRVFGEQVMMIKAMEYLRNNDLSKSEELLQRAEKLNPDMRGLLSAWGYLYYNQHKLDKSFEYFKRHLDKYPDDYPIYGAFAEF